ncbi:MAG: ATP-binding cassette domain-containing protein [Anaerolineae bacterium]|nr:ATP-binding cassette domain-containing protein [Anaerolineae bacterium]
MSNNHHFIRLDRLSKGFQEGGQTRAVLRNADAGFARGEFVAILGKSGSGKSTLLNLISGIGRVDGGDIWVDGQQLTSLDERQRTLFRRQNIGFIFQFFNLIPTLTVWENVVLPLELAGVDNGPARRQAETLLEAVGLLDRRDTFPDRLSGGEQQRVSIARAPSTATALPSASRIPGTARTPKPPTRPAGRSPCLP